MIPGIFSRRRAAPRTEGLFQAQLFRYGLLPLLVTERLAAAATALAENYAGLPID